MQYEKRYLSPQISHDLAKKMVFVGGPRQVGKTTLAKHLLFTLPPVIPGEMLNNLRTVRFEARSH